MTQHTASLTICIGASDVTGCDSVNAVDTCFQFVAPFGEGPRPSLLTPYADACVSCETPFRVTTLIASDNAIADTSLLLHFTSTFGDCDSIYTIDDPEVTLIMTADSLTDTLYFDIPADCYGADADIQLTIDQLNDVFGNAHRPYSVNFHVDWEGPLAEVTYPTAPISDLTPDLRIHVWDSGCGINHTTPVLEVTPPGGPTYSYSWGDAPLSWAGDTLIFSTPDSLGFAGSDIIHVCLVHQLDTVDVRFCEANDIDTAYCFDVVINGDGPMPYLVSPHEGDIVTCECPEFIFAFDDSDGVDESTIEIQIGDEILTEGWTFSNDSVYIDMGEVCFEDGELVTIEILAADDMLRNPVLAGFTWDITIDLTPPYADSLVPPVGSFVYDDRTPLIGIYPRDMYSGISETASVRITYDGIDVTYDMEDPALFFDPVDTSFWFDITMTDMDTLCEYTDIQVEFDVTDYTGDSMYCDPNDTVIAWSFQIGDDDTLGPVFVFDSTAWPAYSESLVITVHISDTSGVYDDETTMEGQGIYVEIDTTDDGIWNADTFLAAELDSADLYTTVMGAFPSPNLTEGMHFCFRYVAYDNDFDCENTIDRHSATSEEYCYQIYNIIAPELSILMPQDSSHYSCLCDSQEISFVLLDPDRVVLDNMVISINDVNYYYPDPRITIGGVDITREVYWTPQTDECFEDGERVDVRVWGYSDIYLNFPEDTLSWTFIADQSAPIVTNADTTTRLYAEDVTQIALYVNDPDGEIDPARIQVQVSVNDETPVILTEADYPALRYESEADSLYIDVRALTGYTPTARDSIFIDVIEICDNAIGCGPNCFSGLRFFKFIKYETFCSSHPKPFTPNGDHINDIVQIEYPKRFETQATVTITDLSNKEIQKVEMRSDSRYLWDGTDSGGHPCRQGVYIFAVEVEGEVVCTGTIVLAR